MRKGRYNPVYIVALAAIVIAACAVLFMNLSKRPTMKWAKELKASDISKIEMLAMPSSNTPYRLFEEEEFADIVKLINESRGRFVPKPESLAGGSIAFYITMADGTVHQVCNSGNTYLYIDGDNYDAGYNWLSKRWAAYSRGNAAIPEGFEFEY